MIKYVKPDAKKNRRVAISAALVFAGMVGMAYASVPLYKVFCQQTGFGGTTQRAEKAPDKATDQFISVRFDSNSASELNWRFKPKQTSMRVRIGEQNMAYFEATNLSDKVKTGSAVYNVAPPLAGAFFNKIQCFCFTKQTLKPGESAEFPVVFFVDPSILQDADAKGTQEITLSYTFYPADADAPKQVSTN
ncbi:cytochrome c oxidase assembly protein [Aestuariivirga litoralis]|uniref:cytochrome c oxidase assembly protein n=1 Tax=Aestuariivirga litoralis TaxID=2650924 RepID=UPI0018C7A966|nr:cytochrome c oxidase assembly protein [Aestuariivirga litoralis]MBG1233421.1 cytochrome c oxidase assembly protein [Aestuariivirga litoralis]